jgi:EAL domain-containing protein (putative c-di-GMP-specific phosphodiesterase class I)/CheY-like chemotaxis protein
MARPSVQGSTLLWECPLKNALNPYQAPEPSIGELRFLVVEDHGFQRWALGNLLVTLGAKQVLSARDGQSALDILEGAGEPIDIIVSDLDMPGMDGMEFMRHLGERNTPGCVILASEMDRPLIAAVEAMAKEYGVELLAGLQKPVTPKKIESALRRFRGRPRGKAAGELHSFGPDEIRDGLKKSQFEPFFQAKVRLSDRKVVGAEALARWRHPTKGLLTAASFIDAIEDAELHEMLTTVMLRKAAQSCRSWRPAGVATVSVNLSPHAMKNLALADEFVAIVEEHGLEPAQVILEVTESAAASPRSLENLLRLRMKGFGLSIDDYGTGYSSMQRMTRIAFTELKIDRAFVKNALRQKSSLAMLESSLEMARKLQITAVAEGVEKQAEWDLLCTLGCDLAQGFLIAHPMGELDFLEWLRQCKRSP